jgi:hypothetical protein
MVSLFAGGINLCSLCRDSYRNETTNEHLASPEFIGKSLEGVIQSLYDSLSFHGQSHRFLVINVFTLFNQVSPIYEAGKDSFWCRKVHDLGAFCNCLYDGDQQRADMDATIRQYNKVIIETVHRWQNRTDIDPSFRLNVIRTVEALDTLDLGSPHVTPTDW